MMKEKGVGLREGDNLTTRGLKHKRVRKSHELVNETDQRGQKEKANKLLVIFFLDVQTMGLNVL